MGSDVVLSCAALSTRWARSSLVPSSAPLGHKLIEGAYRRALGAVGRSEPEEGERSAAGGRAADEVYGTYAGSVITQRTPSRQKKFA